MQTPGPPNETEPVLDAQSPAAINSGSGLKTPGLGTHWLVLMAARSCVAELMEVPRVMVTEEVTPAGVA
jgi:hypothetical protein